MWILITTSLILFTSFQDCQVSMICKGLYTCDNGYRMSVANIKVKTNAKINIMEMNSCYKDYLISTLTAIKTRNAAKNNVCMRQNMNCKDKNMSLDMNV